MKIQELLNKIADQDHCASPDGMVTPTPEVIAFHLRYARKMRQLKKDALAHMAGVSLSTIERVERADNVSDECLDKIAVALGQEPGYYTAKRRPIPQQEAAEKFEETYGEMQQVEVAPLRKQTQVRELATCHGFLINRPGLDATFDGDIANLTEWFDLASFVLNEFTDGGNGGKGRRRELYNSVLNTVTALERRGVTVLAGTMAAPQPDIPDWKIGIISISLKETDPGAIKRRVVLVDRRWGMMDTNDWLQLSPARCCVD